MPAALRDVPQEAIELIKSFEGIPDGDPATVNIDAYQIGRASCRERVYSSV